jgi:hypothetical protein
MHDDIPAQYLMLPFDQSAKKMLSSLLKSCGRGWCNESNDVQKRERSDSERCTSSSHLSITSSSVVRGEAEGYTSFLFDVSVHIQRDMPLSNTRSHTDMKR